MCQAWEIYCSVFRSLSQYLTGLKRLDLRHVAPRLLTNKAKDLMLAVPGTYRPHQRVVRIQSFSPSILVLASKQRPRRLTMLGSDGRKYMFLLKGHEDLRQDERMMQLFGLVNALLRHNPATARSNLHITRYNVMPLSANSGVIGWVKNCDTLHQLVKDYRESRRVRLNLEQRLLAQAAPSYEKLPLLGKVEVFKSVMLQTRGMEIAKMLWLKSSNSEIWLERRNNYTRSLAVMSMAGYILGLGDRHPSNLMLDRISGRIVHIDFGDCFEVSMTRSKFPETVPFRLTRMLINGMEGGGVEGSFRLTCENVLEVLRNNRESLMAMLEAFVHDPLVSWRHLPSVTSAPASAARAAVADAAAAAAPPEAPQTSDAVAAAAAGGGGSVAMLPPSLSASTTFPSLAVIMEEGGEGGGATSSGPGSHGGANKPFFMSSSLAAATTRRRPTAPALSSSISTNNSSSSRNVLMMVSLAAGERAGAGGGGSSSSNISNSSSSNITSRSPATGAVTNTATDATTGPPPSPLPPTEAGLEAAAATTATAAAHLLPTRPLRDIATPNEDAELNQQALDIMHRIQQKLLGRDYPPSSSSSSLASSSSSSHSRTPSTTTTRSSVDEEEGGSTPKGGGEGPDGGDEELATSSSSSSSSTLGQQQAPLSVQEQVDMLIRRATSAENLCRLFMGWAPFW